MAIVLDGLSPPGSPAGCQVMSQNSGRASAIRSNLRQQQTTHQFRLLLSDEAHYTMDKNTNKKETDTVLMTHLHEKFSVFKMLLEPYLAGFTSSNQQDQNTEERFT